MSIHLQENKHYTPYGTLGGAIRHFRNERKFTQSQLAERIGVTQGNIAHYESGRITPPLKVLKKLSTELNININLLVSHRLDIAG
jgi:transcriptional regulator with XRE-family HTH domain